MSRGVRGFTPCPTTAGEKLAPSRGRYVDRGQCGLEPLPQVLELRRQHQALAQVFGLVVERGPGHMVHSSRSGNAATFSGRGVEDVTAAALVATNLPRRGALRREAERALEELAASLSVCGVGAHLFEALNGVFSRNLGVRRGERRVGGGDHAKLEAKTFGVGELE